MSSSESFVQTDRTLKRQGSLEWNQNPSYISKQTQEEAVVSIRTAESILAEVGRHAIAKGLVSKSKDAQQMNALLQVTGKDGLCWDSNPTFSEAGTPMSRSGDRENYFSCESPLIERGKRSVSCHMRSLEEFLFSSMDRMETTSSKRPWDEQDPAYEWMEIIRMKDVSVQTDFDLDDTSNDLNRFSATSSCLPDKLQSSFNTAEHKNEDERITSDGGSAEVKATTQEEIVTNSLKRWDSAQESTACCQHKEATTIQRADKRCPMSPISVLEDAQSSSVKAAVLDSSCKDDVRHQCSTSGESDAFNNLPFPNADHLDVLPEDKPVLYNNNVAQVSLKSSIQLTPEASRLDLMEREVRELKMRVTDLELEVCSKDIIIAQQDAVIHRFTSSLRSARSQRRTFPVDLASDPRAPNFQELERQAKHRSFSTFEEASNTDVVKMIHAQQKQIRLLMDQLSNCHIA